MTSMTWSNDVDSIKMTIFRFPKSMAITAVHSKFRHFSFHKLIGGSLEILNLCRVLKKHEPVHAKHGKCIFVPRGKFLRMRTTNMNLVMQKGSRVVHMLIAHKNFHFIFIFKR